MDFSQFDGLAKKVETAIGIIDGLKNEKTALQTELHAALEKSGNLEKHWAEREEEIATMRSDLDSKADNINSVEDRIREMVGRLDTALA